MELPLEQSTPRRSSNQSTMDSEKQATMVSPSIMDTSVEETPRPSLSTARSIYLKIVLGATSLIVVLIFSVFSIYWGSLWKIPAHNLHGWVVDFDGGLVGQKVAQSLGSDVGPSKVTWSVIPASQVAGGLDELATLVREEHTWVAVAIHSGASAKLNAALTTPNSSYAGSEVITVYAAEARNENAFRNIIRPSVQSSLDAISASFALQISQSVANTSTLSTLMASSPQTITMPISYTIDNLVPFDIPVASAATFVGLLYQTILSFFIVMITLTAREISGFNKSLSLRNLILLRFASSFGAYFFVTFFYTLLNVAFHLPMSRNFGHAGFILFWMLSYAGMLSVGLALESLVTLLTVKFIPFFMITWIITNISVCIYPIEVLPRIFHYGYVAPFYNISRAMRTIIFGTKNELAMHFGVLIVWIAISCITLPLIQWFVRRRDERAAALRVAHKALEV
ncbi:hypothetical protein K443DRAFT_679145 [Laccaria amethystina LaAM-08-1]|uniref:DUF3533 domain-containing protein n=1 Tax=Laccaria amethystina LaAM-08-1 TaxID=1095629 RepID=A0A0C9XXD6_9AGAR|nr:hypothetical protein K443DRAFT_679145 [Laccaria amethystina LaAM-08-1]